MTAAHAEWLEERKLGIGGSDCADVCNAGYGCRLRLWREKRGETPDYPREDTNAMKLGKYLEPWFAQQYEEKTGRAVVVRPDPFVHAEYPEMRCHVDRIVIDPTRKDAGVLELKAVGRDVYFRVKREGLPEDYILQEQHNMIVTDSEWGSYGVGSRDSGDLLTWDVERDRNLERHIIGECQSFWKQVQTGDKPERLEPDDRRCQKCEYRVSCQGAALIQLEPASKCENDESLRPLVAEYKERQGLVKEAEALFEEAYEELKTKLGDRTAVKAGGHPIYFRPQTSMLWQARQLAAAYAELRNLALSQVSGDSESQALFFAKYPLAAQFQKASVSRPLRVY